MGSFRYYRRFGRGPVKFLLSKRGVGLNVGVPGMHATLNSRGRLTRTIGWPGTGAGWQDTKTVLRPPYTQPQVGAGLLLAIIVVIAILFSR